MAEIATENKLLATKHHRFWHFLLHPIAAFIWFVLAIGETLYLGYLDSDVVYQLDLHLLFFTSVTLLVIAWLLHGLLLPVSKRYLIWACLGLFSFLALIADGTDLCARWLGFAYGMKWTSWMMFAISLLVSIWLFHAFVKTFLIAGGKKCWQITAIVVLPCLLLLTYNFLLPRGFLEQKEGDYPSYSQALYQHLPVGKKVQKLDVFLKTLQ